MIIKGDADTIAKDIRLIILDVDGVLTDGGIYVDSEGQELYKPFNVKDGLGITLAKREGLPTAIITGRQSSIVANRAKELKIDLVYQGSLDKRAAYREIKERLRLKDEHIAYIGDDVIDVPIMKLVGLPIAVGDAVHEVKELALIVAGKNGGEGAVRECYEYILRRQRKWENIISHYMELELVSTEKDAKSPTQARISQ